MPRTLDLLAFDLGAESGRAVLGRFDGERLHLTEVHRFPNEPVRLPNGLHWDVLRLFGEVKRGLMLCASEHGQPAGVGVDAGGAMRPRITPVGRALPRHVAAPDSSAWQPCRYG